MSITHTINYCVSNTDQKKIETFFVGNNNINITRNKNKPKMDFLILDTPVEIIHNYSYVIKLWTYNSQKRYNEYYGCYQGNHYCTIFDTEDDARIEFNNAIQTNIYSNVDLVRLDPDSKEHESTCIDEWTNDEFYNFATCERCEEEYLIPDMEYVTSSCSYFCKECYKLNNA